MKNVIVLLAMAIMLSACQQNQEVKKAEAEAPVVSDLARVPDSWIADRVSKAQSAMNKTEAGQLVWKSMEAHGGLERWFSNGPIAFQFDYQPRGKGARRNTKQIVDTWNNKAVHYAATDQTAAFGWDGKDAWVTEKDTANFNYNLRFWALTPIYFLAQPFNFDGKGVQLEKLTDKTLDGKTYDAVKISFEKGTGDAPDDYYINYYDKETHRLEVLRYIVSYPKYFKDGGHSPEKLMTLHDFTTVNGITLPTAYKTYMMTEEEGKGEYVTDIAVSGIRFSAETKKAFFEVPEGEKVLEGL
ncbi:MAG: hypothetical protein AB8F74_05820 [Saprospiraceae bacterium]